MAQVEIKIPSPGESITHVELTRWLVADGSIVRKNSEIAELESEKATLMLIADESGKITFNAPEGEMLEVGAVACVIDTSVAPEETTVAEASESEALVDAPSGEKVEEVVLPEPEKKPAPPANRPTTHSASTSYEEVKVHP